MYRVKFFLRLSSALLILVLLIRPCLAQYVFVTSDVHGLHSVHFAGQSADDLLEMRDFLIGPTSPIDSVAPTLLRDLTNPEIIPIPIDVSRQESFVDIWAEGEWGHPTLSGPAGRSDRSEMTLPEYGVFGISTTEAPLNSLVGVFLPEQGGAFPPPPSLSKSLGDDMRNPELGQSFVIARNLERIQIPEDATTLYLGLHDGDDWSNNVGTVTAHLGFHPELVLKGLQTRVLDAMTIGPVPQNSSVNAFEDFLDDLDDSWWTTTETSLLTFTHVAEFGDAIARFGLYDVTDPSNRIEVINSSDAPGTKVAVALNADGSVRVLRNSEPSSDEQLATDRFGFYLDSPNNGLFFSDTSINPDQTDHMLAYQGNGVDAIQLPGSAIGVWTNDEYLLAWEDLFNGGDRDYEDFVVMVDGANPVPEPSSVLCWLVLLGCFLLSKKRW